ncbi:MAG: hypothetical protein ACM3UR_06530 [Bacteroidota bacterium]
MIRSIFILSLLLIEISASKGVQDSFSPLSHADGIFLLQTEDSGTQAQGALQVQDLNEDENELILVLPRLHFIDSLAILYSPGYKAASLAVEVNPRPPRG